MTCSRDVTVRACHGCARRSGVWTVFFMSSTSLALIASLCHAMMRFFEAHQKVRVFLKGLSRLLAFRYDSESGSCPSAVIRVINAAVPTHHMDRQPESSRPYTSSSEQSAAGPGTTKVCVWFVHCRSTSFRRPLIASCSHFLQLQSTPRAGLLLSPNHKCPQGDVIKYEILHLT